MQLNLYSCPACISDMTDITVSCVDTVKFSITYCLVRCFAKIGARHACVHFVHLEDAHAPL